MRKNIFGLLIALMVILVLFSRGDESLFSPAIIDHQVVKKAFSFLEEKREEIIQNWISLTEMPAPSGKEERRAKYLYQIFQNLGLEQVQIDKIGNVHGIWPGQRGGKKILISAHMDTVFQGIDSIKVRREGNVLKAPGIGDDTASLINLIWTIKAFQASNFQPRNTLYFLATVGEEVGFVGMKAFLEKTEEKFDLVLALDGDLGKIHYGALGFGGGKVIFRGRGAHTMQSRGVPNPALAVAKTISRLYQIDCAASPVEKWTILNVGMIGGGRVTNAVPQEAYLTIDLRSASQEELTRVQEQIKEICAEVAREERVDLEISLNQNSPAYQLPGAKDSYLVKTARDVLEFLKVKDIEVDPLGSTEANVGLAHGGALMADLNIVSEKKRILMDYLWL